MSNWRKAGYTSTVLLALTVMAILFPISFRSATPVEGATKGATASTITFTSNTSSTSASLSVSNTSGSFVSSSSNASFSIETNNATGYTLNIKTSNDATTLSDGNNHTIPSIETSKTASNFTNNAWGLLPSKYNGTNNTTNYYPASSNGFTMDTTSSSNTGNANTYTVGLGLKADYTIPAGTYTNTTIVAEYVANPITYAIYYYTNTTDTVTGMPSPNPQVPVSSFPGTTATTTNLASAPSRTGYTFLGWCLGTSSSSNITVGTNGNADTCGNSFTNQFTAGQSFGINATGSSPDLYYFYAMWQAIIYTIIIDNTNTTTSTNSLSILYGSSATVTVTPASGYYLSSVSCPSGVSCTGYSTGESYTGAQTVAITNNTATTSSGTLSFVAEEPKVYMQDMTLADCPTGGAKVYDKRDESSYTVKKLADGNCWMTQNLALDLTALTQAQLYGTGTNAGKLTNASNTTLGYLKSGGGTSPYTNYAVAAATSTNYYDRPAIATSGTCNNASCTNSNLSWSYTDTLAATINGTTSRVQGKVGIYYNYCAASAGSYCYSSSSSSGNATEDICPYGWHLPAGDTAQGSFYYLYNTGYSANYNNFVDALSTPLSGFFNSGKARNQGNSGYFWSSTRNSNYNMYYLYVYSSSVNPQNYITRDTGRSVRCVKEPIILYNTIAAMSKGTQTAADLQAAITTSNSGVYEYNASVFGTASDAANTSKIYYYRGILDETVGSYGSDGDGKAWPNYVILQAGSSKATTDTCWRIVRTTGSGGVKMIYNGLYGNTTSGSCANATTAAQIRSTSATSADSTATFTSAFAGTGAAQYRSIVGVGYTRNATYAKTSATTATAYSTLFGTNSSYSGNSTNSTIKSNVETWFTNNLNSYASKLEASAGYCNDRTLYPSGSYATSNLISDSTTIVPYGTSSVTVYHFGAYTRNSNSAQTPTLTCPRSTVDLYTTSSASNGNKQLSKPVALLTADEMSFAGSGSSVASNGSGYSANSYLRSGSVFWLLSPNYRASNGFANEFYLSSGGNLNGYSVNSTYGVRPVISLVSGTTISSGSGTATDPWVVTP